MSVHSMVSSNITKIDDLIAILNQAGIEWRHLSDFYMKDTGRRPAYAIEANIGNELVWIHQVRKGTSFQFQSENWRFRNRGKVEDLAAMQYANRLPNRSANNARQRTQQPSQSQRTDHELREEKVRQQRAVAERNRLAESKMQEEAIRKQRMHDELVRAQRDEAERNRLAEEAMKAEAARILLEEQQRQTSLADEAKRLLNQLDIEPSRSITPAIETPINPGEATSTSVAQTEQMERIIGRLHQANALRRIRDRLPELKEKFGATLDREETLEDETVELRLMI